MGSAAVWLAAPISGDGGGTDDHATDLLDKTQLRSFDGIPAVLQPFESSLLRWNVDAPTGTYVSVEPGVKRTAYAEEPGTTLLAIGATPGQAYEPSGWELWTEVAPLYNAKRYDEAADRARELVEAHPEYSAMLYNLACVESLAGRKEDALAHLREGVARSDRFRELAAEDSDFDAIRDEPEFKELIAG